MWVPVRHRSATWTLCKCGSMAISNVQNPFDPTGWTGRVEIVEYDTQGLGPGDATQVLDFDAYRLFAVFTCPAWPSSLMLWPFAQRDAYGIGPQTGQNYVLIHNASFPGLLQWAWFAKTGVPLVEFNIVVGRAIT